MPFFIRSTELNRAKLADLRPLEMESGYEPNAQIEIPACAVSVFFFKMLNAQPNLRDKGSAA
jgi:hypothetical protein